MLYEVITDEGIAVVEVDGTDAGAQGTGEGRQGGLLHGTVAGGEEDILVIVEGLHRQYAGDALVLVQRQQVDDGATAGGAVV